MEGYLVWGYTIVCILPSLFGLADPKEAWVKDVWIRIVGGEGVGVLASLGLLMIGRWMR